MISTLPFQFRLRWNQFFASVLAQFLGYNSYAEATPIVKAIIDFSRLAVAFLIACVVVNLIIKFIRVVFG